MALTMEKQDAEINIINDNGNLFSLMGNIA